VNAPWRREEPPHKKNKTGRRKGGKKKAFTLTEERGRGEGKRALGERSTTRKGEREVFLPWGKEKEETTAVSGLERRNRHWEKGKKRKEGRPEF